MKNTVQLDEKIKFFNELLLQMVTRVEEAILKSTIAFRDQDVKLAEKVVSDDYFIDKLRDMIETDGVRLLISESPYAHYMRHVIAGMKMVTSLERMGDHAAHLAKVSSKIDFTNEKEKKIVDKIVEMALSDAKMFRLAVEALSSKDEVAAYEIAKMDNKIDDYRLEINELIYNEGSTNNKNMYEYFYIVKELERMGDHVTTICEWIVYMVKGERPKLNN